jgi:putative ABC transport system permease protein
MATPGEPLVWFLNLRLGDPADAAAYAAAYDLSHQGQAVPRLTPWPDIAAADAKQISIEQEVLVVGSWLLGLLAIASVAVLAGGRMAGQVRRVGLLKAVGATPGLVAVVLLAEHLLLAVVAAALGLVFGWLAAPLFTSPGAGLIGSAGAPSITVQAIVIVVAVALVVAAAATLIPALRGARTSTIGALDDAARPPGRRALVTRLSARLPVPLLLGLRLAARRPRRTVLSAASVVVTVAGIVTVLMAHAGIDANPGNGEVPDPLYNSVSQVLTVITVALVALSAVNALLVTWATVLDARQSSALTRALGATPGQVSAGLAVAQTLPALLGAIVGTPPGIVLYAAVRQGAAISYPVWWLIAVVAGAPLVISALTLVPSRIAARSSVAPVLQSEAA